MKDMRKTITNFGHGEIDPRVYAHDITLNDLETLNDYRIALANGDYDETCRILNESDVCFFGAWMLNLLENRLQAIGNYLNNELERDVLTYASETEPENVEYGISWIADEFDEAI